MSSNYNRILKNMIKSKFKVGDIIQVKPYEQILKFKKSFIDRDCIILSDGIGFRTEQKCICGMYFKIYNVDIHSDIFTYNLINDGTMETVLPPELPQNGILPWYFSDMMLDEVYPFDPNDKAFQSRFTKAHLQEHQIQNACRRQTMILVDNIKYLLDVKEESEILSKIIDLKRNQKS